MNANRIFIDTNILVYAKLKTPENQCDILFTEDLQHDQIIRARLRIRNPFIGHSISRRRG